MSRPERMTVREMQRIAWQIRLALVEMFGWGKAHHYGGSLSCTEIVTALYFHAMNYSAAQVDDPQRDRLIMSKGHSVPTQYAALALLGVLPENELATIKRLGSRLQGHPDPHRTPGIEAHTGSLGQGLSFANGVALGARLDGRRFNLYVVLGDGELQEGQVWEAAMTTAHYRLANVCAVVDRNRHQSQGEVDRLMAVEPLVGRFEAFGWRAKRVNGHDVAALCRALDALPEDPAKPLAIVADTVKGRGVGFLENSHVGHNSVLTAAQYHEAVAGIRNHLATLEDI
jgi:transketolase